MADPKVSGIYAIRNTISGKCYVGSAIRIARRWSVHRSNLKSGTHRCKPLQRSWDKHGADAFTFEVLEAVAIPGELIIREQYWIDSLLSHCDLNGYNVCPKAESRLGMKMSADARAKIGNAHRGRKATDEARAAMKAGWLTRAPISEETRAKMAQATRGKKRTPEQRARLSAALLAREYKMSDEQKAAVSLVHKGKNLSAEQRAAVSLSNSTRIRTPEERAKNSAAHKGRVKSEETRQKISAAKKGKPLSLEHRARLSILLKLRPPITPEARANMCAAQKKRYAKCADAGQSALDFAAHGDD